LSIKNNVGIYRKLPFF
jgi:hypothetical protein